MILHILHTKQPLSIFGTCAGTEHSKLVCMYAPRLLPRSTDVSLLNHLHPF